MEWTQVITLVGSNIVLALMSLGTTITLFLWARSEARQDQAENRQFQSEMKNEMKDYHARLLVLEERYLNWLMRDK